ncbi:nucleotide sugar dehydrogenase, partial [bacterium]|nr:nucleotide sugar dehydrogenase [bacterium]
DISYVLKAIASVGKLLESKDLVLLRSTIPVGFTQEEVIPELEKQSGLKVGEDFHIAFAPERTAEGVALKELRYNPQIVGGYDDKSYELAASLFNSFTPSIIHVKSLEAAEMCKLLDNTYRDHKFAFANQLTKLTERLGLDLCEIIEALNHGYSRNDIPKPSPGVGGPCLSKDPYILSSVFKQHDLDSSLILNCRKVNELGPVQVKETLEKLLKKADKKITSAKLFLIGFAFKGTPETSDLRGSTSLAFLDLLPDKQNIRGYDPVVSSNDIRGLGITPVSLEEGFENADAAIILNNHPSYQDINIVEMFSKMNRPAVFIDTWHIFDPLDIKRIGGLLYGGVGNV